MASCKVVWRTSAERELRKLPREIIADMVDLASKLANDPFPHGGSRTQCSWFYANLAPLLCSNDGWAKGGNVHC